MNEFDLDEEHASWSLGIRPLATDDVQTLAEFHVAVVSTRGTEDACTNTGPLCIVDRRSNANTAIAATVQIGCPVSQQFQLCHLEPNLIEEKGIASRLGRTCVERLGDYQYGAQ